MDMEPLLLCTTPIATFAGPAGLTNATGFFFQRDDRLYLASSRHVFVDQPTNHQPDRIVITIHTDRDNATQAVEFSIPLYIDGQPQWIAGIDAQGEIDVAVIQIDTEALPAEAVYRAFTPDNLLGLDEQVDIGTPMLIVGFPMGFHDTLHNLPVARNAINASSFALRFQGNGYFLTDARTHRGSSGAPVVTRNNAESLPWTLLGVHSARLDVPGRDTQLDEALGLNCAWYADILMTLTDPTGAA